MPCKRACEVKPVIAVQTKMNFVAGIVMSRIITFNCVAFLLWQLMYLNYTDAQDDILYGMIKDNENEIHLKWRKTKQLLANEHLPVWTAEYAPNNGPVTHTLKPNFTKENIGEFVMYHDIEKSSAVVYFKKTQTLYGIIDTKYSIVRLPFAERNSGHSVGGSYVRRNVHPLIKHTKPEDFLTHGRIENKTDLNRTSTSGENGSPRKRPRLDTDHDKPKMPTLYPEILVLVPYRTTEAVKKVVPNYHSNIVMDHIIFFNNIDLLFAKLSADDIYIHINIAGIVIDDDKVMPMENYCTNTSEISGNINAPLTMFYQQLYIKRHREVFVKDSFDYFFTSTFLTMQSDNELLEGLSNGFNVYEARLHSKYYGNILGMMIRRGPPFDYVVAAHEIGHLMDLEHDGEGLKPCVSVMQPGGGACADCLRWSDASIRQLRQYIGHNRNHCYLLNRPRALHPHGQPIQTLLPSDQCHCYGFSSYKPIEENSLLDAVSPIGCNQNMICSNDHCEKYVPFPVDGTPCDNGKVCWNEMCQDI